MVISLIGYRATGKTTVGSLLAERLGWTCFDTDVQLQHWVGKSIREIFAEEGEAKFREYEAQVVRDLARRHKVVLALGGGAVLRPENRQAIRVAGPVVWLTAEPATIQARLADDPETQRLRPPLSTGSAVDEVQRVLAERLPIYQACADCVVNTDGKSPRELVDAILAELDLTPGRDLS